MGGSQDTGGMERLALLLRMLERLRSDPVPADAPDRAAARAAPLRPEIVRSIAADPALFGLHREVGPLLRRSWHGAVESEGAVLHVTSSQSGEGVSSLARALARAASALPFARPLLLDCRRGETDQASALGQELPDLVESWLQRGRAEVAAVDTGAGTFHAASHDAFAVRPVSAEADAAPPRRLDDLHAGLRAAYNLIVLDCPPILESGYIPRVGHGTPEVLLVVEADRTRIPVVMRAKDEIAAAGGRLAGVVMNRRRQLIPAMLERHL